MSPRPRAGIDEVWQALVALVMDSRGDWRRKVTEATGLPFSRVRALRRLAGGPLTLRQLAESMGCDAPAATVAVNDLERRGLAERRPHAVDGRVKVVTLTAEGKRAVSAARQVSDAPPPSLAALAPCELAELVRILERVARPVSEREATRPTAPDRPGSSRPRSPPPRPT
jgi:DNA-binding MarR family transcriptional regulator